MNYMRANECSLRIFRGPGIYRYVSWHGLSFELRLVRDLNLVRLLTTLPSFLCHEALSNCEDHRRGYTKHQRAVACFQRPQEFPRRRHDQISITQSRIVHSGVVVSDREGFEFPTHYK